MRLLGCKAQQGRHGGCQRGAATRQGPRRAGPIGPATWAANMVRLNVRELAALCHRVIRALAQTRVLAPTVAGSVDATELETTAQYEGGGQVTRQRKVTDTRGQRHEREVTV